MASGVWHQNELRTQVRSKQISGVGPGNQLSTLMILSTDSLDLPEPSLHSDGTTRTSTAHHNLASLWVKIPCYPSKQSSYILPVFDS